MTSLAQIIQLAESFWPIDGAETWDRPGLVTGSPQQTISRVLLTVDITDELVDDAIAGSYDLVIAHHPYLLKSVTSLAEDTLKGATLAKAIRANLAIYAAHTNADITLTGVSATLARAFGLSDIAPLVPTSGQLGHGRIGTLTTATSLVQFARKVAATLPATATGIRVAGDPDQAISKVALCGGAGDSFIEAALASDADVYVTSDLRHHPTQDALEAAKAAGRDFSLIDISHWAAESLWLSVAANELGSGAPGVKFEVSDLRTDPWDFAVTQ